MTEQYSDVQGGDLGDMGDFSAFESFINGKAEEGHDVIEGLEEIDGASCAIVHPLIRQWVEGFQKEHGEKGIATSELLSHVRQQMVMCLSGDIAKAVFIDKGLGGLLVIQDFESLHAAIHYGMATALLIDEYVGVKLGDNKLLDSANKMAEYIKAIHNHNDLPPFMEEVEQVLDGYKPDDFTETTK